MEGSWIDRAAYPFAPHYLEVDGGRMHYIDEGQGPPLVMVHGTPTWSFLYRKLVQRLSRSYRCIVPDHIGFGLSDRPAPHELRVPDHARNLETLIDHLGLKDLTLVVHDFGGPIGLNYALNRPENVRALVLFNTWLWSLLPYPTQRRVLSFVANPVGRFLYRRLNFSARMIIKSAWGDRSTLTPELHRQYIGAFPTADSRAATVQFAREALASSAWYDQQWARREVLQSKPTLLIWGEKDQAFGQMITRWRSLFPAAQVVSFPEVGHFPQEERPAQVGDAVESFLQQVYPAG